MTYFKCPRCSGDGFERPLVEIEETTNLGCVLCNYDGKISREQVVALLVGTGHLRLAKKISDGWPSNSYGMTVETDQKYGLFPETKQLPIRLSSVKTYDNPIPNPEDFGELRTWEE